MVDEKALELLLESVKERFGLELLRHDKVPPPRYRDDVTVHGFFDL